MSEHESLFQRAEACLTLRDPVDKAQRTHEAAAAWRARALGLHAPEGEPSLAQPGRPDQPVLVPPGQVPRRGVGTLDGRAALVHAVAHIEFNAINLAWDAVYRFRDLPAAYYDDWVRVADEEARHFELLAERLRALGYAYGDFPAHNGLWEAAQDTAHDPLVRMALVPRVLEARGLDVTPGMIERLRAVGDTDTVAALEVIFEEEKGHVGIGSRWFRYLCGQRGLEARQTFRELVEHYMKDRVRGPFHEAARTEAGFTPEELVDLKTIGASG